MPDGIVHTAHSPTCYLAEQGRSEYVVPARESYRKLDRNGVAYRDRRGSSWIAFACNDPNCQSEARVRWDVLMAFLAEHNTGTEPHDG